MGKGIFEVNANGKDPDKSTEKIQSDQELLYFLLCPTLPKDSISGQ